MRDQEWKYTITALIFAIVTIAALNFTEWTIREKIFIFSIGTVATIGFIRQSTFKEIEAHYPNDTLKRHLLESLVSIRYAIYVCILGLWGAIYLFFTT